MCGCEQDYGIYNAMNDEEYAKVHKYVQENTDEDGALTDDDRRSDAGFLEPLNEASCPAQIPSACDRLGPVGCSVTTLFACLRP